MGNTLLVAGASGRSLCQTVYFEGREHLLSEVNCDTQWDGCSGQLQITGRIGDIRVTHIVTLHAALDRAKRLSGFA